MTRVSTVGNYATVLANLMAAQQKQVDAGDQVASQKNGKDLKDFAKDSEILGAMRTVQSRLQVFQDQNQMIGDRLATQTQALNQVASAAEGVRQAMANALAGDLSSGMIEDITAQFRNAVEGMNARYGGKYVFSGGQIDTRPMSATTLSDLTVPPATISSFFHNDDFVTKAKLDEATSVNVGILADDIGTDMMTAFQTLQSFQEGANGPFDGKLTPAQRTFLESQLAVWDNVRKDVTNIAGRNGLNEARVETVAKDLVNRDDQLKIMVGGIVDADMPLAITRLQQAQTSVQAAAQVFASLQSVSLLNILK